MLLCGLDQAHDLRFTFRIHHEVGNAAQLRVLDRVHFLLRVAVTVAEPNFAGPLDLIGREGSLQLREEFCRNVRLGNFSRIVRPIDVCRIHFRFENLAHPWKEAGQLLAA